MRSSSSYVIPVHCLSLMKAVREFCNASKTASVVLEIWERLMVTLALSSCATARGCNVKTCRQGHEFKTGGYMSAYVMHIHPALERRHEPVDNCRPPLLFAFQRIDHGIGPADNGYFIRVMTETRPRSFSELSTMKSKFFRSSFSCACAVSSWVSRAKPMSFCPSRFIWPSVWAMSRVGFRRRRGHRLHV